MMQLADQSGLLALIRSAIFWGESGHHNILGPHAYSHYHQQPNTSWIFPSIYNFQHHLIAKRILVIMKDFGVQKPPKRYYISISIIKQ